VTKREDDLTVAIVDSLKSSPRSKHDVDLIVRWQIDVLRKVIKGATAFGERADNKRYGREIEALARELVQKLDVMPSGTHQALVASSTYSGLPTSAWPYPEDADWEAIQRYSEGLRAHLVALQAGAAAIKAHKVGYYHTIDKTKRFCAGSAFDLMIGLEAGVPTHGDPLRFIANSLFQIITPGDEDRDLRGQCDDILARWRKYPDRLQKHTKQLRHDFSQMIAEKSDSSVVSINGD
jgi:hypothetical protein